MDNIQNGTVILIYHRHKPVDLNYIVAKIIVHIIERHSMGIDQTISNMTFN
jgi:hypothetical protein